MRRIAILSTLASIALLGVPARADVMVEGVKEPLPPNLSPEFVDPVARTRFHLLTRFAPAEGDPIFNFEVSAYGRISEHVALGFGLPFGLNNPGNGLKAFFGDARVSAAGGGAIKLDPSWNSVGGPTLRLGGQFDYYLPTRPVFKSLDPSCDRIPVSGCDLTRFGLSLHPTEPGYYLSGATAFRVRAHADFSIKIVQAEVELGLTPAFTVDGSKEVYLFLSYAFRARVAPTRLIEPFIELGGGSALSAPDPNRYPLGPFAVTPGLRFHFGGLDPAIMLSIPLGSNRLAPVVVMLDLAGAQERTMGSAPELRDPLDF